MVFMEVVVGMLLLVTAVCTNAGAWWGASRITAQAESQWAADIAADNTSEDSFAGVSASMNVGAVGSLCVVTVSPVPLSDKPVIHVVATSPTAHQSLWLFQ